MGFGETVVAPPARQREVNSNDTGTLATGKARAF